jgi:hypothetical protein
MVRRFVVGHGVTERLGHRKRVVPADVALNSVPRRVFRKSRLNGVGNRDRPVVEPPTADTRTSHTRKISGSSPSRVRSRTSARPTLELVSPASVSHPGRVAFVRASATSSSRPLSVGER